MQPTYRINHKSVGASAKLRSADEKPQLTAHHSSNHLQVKRFRRIQHRKFQGSDVHHCISGASDRYLLDAQMVSWLGHLELHHLMVLGARRKQFFVSSNFSDAAILQHHDLVGPPNCTEPMRDDECCAILE